jgi:D-alanine-D-alanine ligase
LKKLRVAVLMGGTSAERDISLSTGRQILAALDPEKYIPIALDAAALSGRSPAELPVVAEVPRIEAVAAAGSAGGELVAADLSQITAAGAEGRPDVVFIALHGKGGEDGTVQGMLELLGIPYTGSGVLASALAMDKAMAKKLLQAEGIPVPAGIVLRRDRAGDADGVRAEIEASFGYPAVVKPNAQGSTIGCTIAREPGQVQGALAAAFAHDSVVLVEEFITGTEITAGVLGNDSPHVLPLVEIEARGGFYDYEAKYATGGSAHIIPARLSTEAAAKATEYAERCHRALGCRGMSRTDMMVRGDQPYVLEVNTIPGMTPTSLLPDAARAAGISFGELLDRLIQSALEDRT